MPKLNLKIWIQKSQQILKNSWFWAFFVIISFYLAIGIYNIPRIGLTTDEYSHIGASESYLHGFGLNPEHPLGQKILNTGYFWLYQDGYEQSDSSLEKRRYNRGKDVLLNHSQGTQEVKFWSRWVYLISNLWLILTLIYLTFRWQWLDPKFSFLLSVLYIFSPTFLPHSVLANFDVGGASVALSASLFLFLSLKNIRNWLNNKNHLSWEIILLANLQIWWAMQNKFSNILLLGSLIVWTFGLLVYTYRENLSKFKPILKQILVSILAFFAITTVLYSLAMSKSPSATKMVENSNIVNGYLTLQDQFGWLPQYEEEQIKQTAIDIVRPIRPTLGYLDGTIRTLNRSGDDQPPFLFGEWTEYAYFDFSIRIFWFKETPAVILLLIIALGGWLVLGLLQLTQKYKNYPNSSHKTDSWIQLKLAKYSWRKTLNQNLPILSAYLSLLLFPLVYAYMTLDSGLVIGYRHAYPLVIFVYALIAWSLAVLVKKISEKNQVYSQTTFILFNLLIIIFGIIAIPQQINYISPIWNKPKWELVNESTINWGQDQAWSWKFLIEEEGIADQKNIQIASSIYFLVPLPSEVAIIDADQEILRKDLGLAEKIDQNRYFDPNEILIENQEWDYLVVDTRFFQTTHSSFPGITEIGKKNHEYVLALEPAYDYQGIVQVYRLP